jgi:hypothetical protein
MASEIWDVFAPDGCKKVIASIQANVQETGYNEDEVRFGEYPMTSIQYIVSGKNPWVINGILIQVSPFCVDYPENPEKVEVTGCVLRLDGKGTSMDLGKPTRVWFDQWYDELCNNNDDYVEQSSEEEFSEVEDERL